MKKTVYYFSGTGNSLAVARDISQKIGAELIPITSLLDEKVIAVSAETIGIVFPLQDFKPPEVVKEFILKLSDIKNKYIFAVCTYGIKPSKSLYKLDKLLKKSGGILSCGFAVKMPQNGIGSGSVTEEDVSDNVVMWESRCSSVCESVENKSKAKPESSPAVFNYINKEVQKHMSVLIKFLKVLLTKGPQALKYTVNDRCSGCGVCEKICPMGNIKIIDLSPVWGDNCANCFGCINWCERRAITLGGNNFNLSTYHHPNVTIKDMIIKR